MVDVGRVSTKGGNVTTAFNLSARNRPRRFQYDDNDDEDGLQQNFILISEHHKSMALKQIFAKSSAAYYFLVGK